MKNEETETGRWLHKVDPLHECQKPSEYDAPPGSTWQCDDCGKVWTIHRVEGMQELNEWRAGYDWGWNVTPREDEEK